MFFQLNFLISFLNAYKYWKINYFESIDVFKIHIIKGSLILLLFLLFFS